MGQSSSGGLTSPLDGTPQWPGGIPDFHLFHSIGGGLSAIFDIHNEDTGPVGLGGQGGGADRSIEQVWFSRKRSEACDQASVCHIQGRHIGQPVGWVRHHFDSIHDLGGL